MRLRFWLVPVISISMVLLVAGCCCPVTPFWLGSTPDTNVPAEEPAPSSESTVSPEPTDFTWIYDLDTGLQKAADEGKPVLLDFWGGG